MSHIKLFALIPMRPGLDRQTFHDHWRHPHGTWARDINTSTRYIQSHRVESRHLGPEQSTYEGVSEVWIEGTEDPRVRRQDPYYVKYIVPDEPNFIDRPRLRFVYTDEEIIQPGPHSGISPDSADSRWRARDAMLSIKLIQIIEQDGSVPWDQDSDRELGHRLGALRHVRARPNRQLHPPDRQPPPAAIGIRELWWPTLSAFEAGVNKAPDDWRQMLARPATALSMLCQAERIK
jgi:hypothetical protein